MVTSQWWSQEWISPREQPWSLLLLAFTFQQELGEKKIQEER